jgi:hypothetical protein
VFAPVGIVRRTAGHLAGCMWARIDGTSRIDYLDEAQQDAAREFCRGLFDSRPAEWNELTSRLQNILRMRRLDTHEVNPRT